MDFCSAWRCTLCLAVHALPGGARSAWQCTPVCLAVHASLPGGARQSAWRCTLCLAVHASLPGGARSAWRCTLCLAVHASLPGGARQSAWRCMLCLAVHALPGGARSAWRCTPVCLAVHALPGGARQSAWRCTLCLGGALTTFPCKFCPLPQNFLYPPWGCTPWLHLWAACRSVFPGIQFNLHCSLASVFVDLIQPVDKLYRSLSGLTVTKACLWLVDCRHHFRLLQAELRARFDEHKEELDMVKAKKILEDAEIRFKKFEHPQPIKCTLCFKHFYTRWTLFCLCITISDVLSVTSTETCLLKSQRQSQTK